MRIVNSEEIETWLFEHANVQGHICDGIKGNIQITEPGDPEPDLVNIAYVDRETGERIDVLYV